MRISIKYQVLCIMLFLLNTYYIILDTPSVHAADSTDSASLQQKLDSLKQEIASKAAAFKKEVNQKLQNKAYVGTIEEITTTQVTVKTKISSQIVLTNEYSLYTDSTNKKKQVAAKDFKRGDIVAGLGDVDDKGNLNAKKLIKLNKDALSVTDHTRWGQIQGSDGSSINIKNREGKKISILTTGNTLFRLGHSEASRADAKMNKFLAAVGSEDKNGNFTARFVYFIPSVGFIKPEKRISTPSASPQKP